MKKALALLVLSLATLPSLALSTRRVEYGGYRIGDSAVLTNETRVSGGLPFTVTDASQDPGKSLSATQVNGQKIVRWWSYGSITQVPATQTVPAHIQYNNVVTNFLAVYSPTWSYNTVSYTPAYLVVDYDYITYTLSYNANGGSETAPSSKNNIVYTNSVELATNTFTRTGYTYQGWAASADGDAAYANKQTVSNLTATTAQVSWTASSNSSSYRVEYGFRGMSQGEGTSVTVNATSYTITGLQPETEYDVYISTVCEGGVMSVWSNVYSFTTPAASGNIYTISAVPADPTMGSVQGGGSYDENTQVTLTAVPNEGYHFVRWQDGNTDNPRVVTVTGNATYVATFEANAGIEDINGAGYVSLYPNPASSTVTVSVEGNESEVVVTIVDMNGREVKRERTSGSVLTMDISSLSQGAYFVRLTGERVNAIRKLIVK